MFENENIGLYRNNGLGIYKNLSKPESEKKLSVYLKNVGYQ